MREYWRPLRIFGIPWHVPHQYSLITALPNFIEWEYLEPAWRSWALESRPIPENLRLGISEYRKGIYDVAILHVDGQCGDPTNNKGALFRQLTQVITDIPIIVINHGTPWLPEHYEKYLKGVTDQEARIQKAYQMCKRHMEELIGDRTMIVNSPKAAEDWGFGTPIIHGIANSPYEKYVDLPKDPVIVYSLSPGGWPYYYNRRVVEGQKSLLREQGLPVKHLRVDVKLNSYEEYKDYIGRALIGVFPFRESPMPRSRTEMMLSGAAIISTKHHNIHDYFTGADTIEDINKDTEILWCDMEDSRDGATKAKYLYENPDVAVRIGQNGKKRAKEVYDVDRYRADWHRLLKKEGVL